MKIKAAQIKPGMVICRKRKWKREIIEDLFLVTAISGRSKIEYTHLDYQDSYGGLLVGDIDGEEDVDVIKNERRKRIIKEITKEVWRNYHDIKNIIDTLRLIEAMDR
jgi:hypothetical protein